MGIAEGVRKGVGVEVAGDVGDEMIVVVGGWVLKEAGVGEEYPAGMHAAKVSKHNTHEKNSIFRIIFSQSQYTTFQPGFQYPCQKILQTSRSYIWEQRRIA